MPGGELNGKIGWFPEAYVERADAAAAAAGDTAPTATASDAPEAAATETTADAAASEGVKARVLYDFTAKEPTEMTLVKGQIVDVTSQVCFQVM